MAGLVSDMDFDIFNRALDLPQAERTHFFNELDAQEPGKGEKYRDLIEKFEAEEQAFDTPLFPSLAGALKEAANNLVEPAAVPTAAAPETTRITLAQPDPARIKPGQTESWQPQPFSEHLPPSVGPYEVIRKIGEGGMGSVFLVRESNPDRRVALKIVNKNVVTAEFLARFQVEYQTLALMNHPHIALMHSAGTTDQGDPYFTMEYVDGYPITQYCEERELTIPQRLELFIQLCEGVFHAHQKAVIHRDLKPSNILVAERDGRPVVKIIDFGIAKGLDMTGSERPFRTATHMMVGTRDYMSPEQMKTGNEEPDTRSDIYSLGVVLYRLLTGCLPYDETLFTGSTWDEMMRVYREQDPPKPSSRLAGLLKRGQETTTFQTSVSKHLRGELDWIVMKAIEKDLNRRYETAAALERDIHAYLKNEPISARPSGLFYKFSKFTRRNRVLVSATTLIFLILLTALAVLLASRSQTIKANRRLNETNRFLMDMLSQADPKNAGLEARVVDVLQNAEKQLREGGLEDKVFEASIRQTLGATYYGLGQYQTAYDQVTRAWEILVELQGRDHPETMQARCLMAKNLRKLKRFDEGAAILQEIMPVQIRILGKGHRDVLISQYELATIYFSNANFAEGAKLYQMAWDGFKIRYGEKDPEAPKCLVGLGSCYIKAGMFSKAKEQLETALRLQELVLSPEHPQTLGTRKNLGTTLLELGEFPQAMSQFRYLETIYMARVGPNHSDTLGTQFNIASCQMGLNEFDAAEELLPQIIAAGEPESKVVIQSRYVLQNIFSVTGRLEEAISGNEAMNFSLENNEKKYLYIWKQRNLAVYYFQQGRFEDSCRLFKETVDLCRSLVGDYSEMTLTAKARYGRSLQKVGQIAQAEKLVKEALNDFKKELPHHPRDYEPQAFWGAIQLELGNYELAEQCLKGSLVGARKLNDLELIQQIEDELALLQIKRNGPEKK